jgi:hypothetical protein
MEWIPFVMVAILTLLRVLDRTDSQLSVAPAPPPPRLKTPLRACPFCGGESRYIWRPGPGGGHRLTCTRCADVYTVNLGGETRWAITTSPTSSELCYAESPEAARAFIEQALSRLVPNGQFQVQLGADETTPSYFEYWHALTQMMKQTQEGRTEVRH